MAAPALTRHVQDVFPTLEHLFDAGEDVASLKTHPGWAAVRLLIDRELATVQSGLDERAPSFSYQELTWAHGRMSGLRALADASEAILERAERSRKEQADKHESAAESAQGG